MYMGIIFHVCGKKKVSFDMNKCKKTFRGAFTLAEVLITLGIIGVVAALTMPTLIQNYKDKVIVTRVNKTYSLLQQSFLSAYNQNGEPQLWGLSDDVGGYGSAANLPGNTNWFNANFKNNVKVVKDCGNKTGCFANQNPLNINGVDWVPFSLDVAKHYYKFVTADGVAIAIKNSSFNCTKNWGSGVFAQSCGHLIVDIDGSKGANTYGKDLFMFVLTPRGYYPSGMLDNLNGATFSATYDWNSPMTTAWVIANKNVDYLHCSDLSWSGKTRCK